MVDTPDINPKRDAGLLFKQDLQKGIPKIGIFLDASSHVMAEQISYAGYDWLLVDAQHSPVDYVTLGKVLSSISNGGCLSMVRVAGYQDTKGIQQALDLGANGILVPIINNKKEAEQAISACLYPTQGTRSVYFPQRSTNEFGLLGYVGNSNKNVVIALQIETASSIDNIEEICSLPGLDIAFLGPFDLALSMGLFEKHKFNFFEADEYKHAVTKMINACEKNKKTMGVFTFGPEKVKPYLEQGFRFISVGHELNHIEFQSATHIKKLEEITKENGITWTKK
jgi:4-hydroxy-2-oxoheptanedioate aldolase